MHREIRFAHLSDWHATTLAGGGLDRFRGKRISGWASWVLNRRRQKVAKGDYSELPFCQTCFIPHSVNYSGTNAQEVGQFLEGAHSVNAPKPSSKLHHHMAVFLRSLVLL